MFIRKKKFVKITNKIEINEKRIDWLIGILADFKVINTNSYNAPNYNNRISLQDIKEEIDAIKDYAGIEKWYQPPVGRKMIMKEVKKDN